MQVLFYQLNHPDVLTKHFSKVRTSYRVSIPSNKAAKFFFFTSKNKTKSPENGIAESVKSPIYIKKAVLKLKK